MTKISRAAFLLFLSLSGPCAGSLWGQAEPAAVRNIYFPGFHLPEVGGNLQYSLSASESVLFGYNGNGGSNASTNLSGNVAYLTANENHPFSMVYSGGYLISSGNQPSAFFQNLALSQVLKTKRWNFVVSDNISYLPQTRTLGLSGIPGTGDLGVDPVQVGLDSGQGLLTNYGARIANSVSASASRSLTASTTFSVTGATSFLTFLGDSPDTTYGYNGHQISASVSTQHRIDARSSVGVAYSYSTSLFGDSSQLSFNTQQATVNYTRSLTRRLSLSAFAGPQRTGGSQVTLNGGASFNVTAGGSLGYSAERGSASLNYTRGTSSGFGVTPGARSDSISLSGSRGIIRGLNTSASLSYTRSSNIANSSIGSFTTQSGVAGVQISKGLTRTLSTFASYSLLKQQTDGLSATTIAFSGISQAISAGITFSPTSYHLNRH